MQHSLGNTNYHNHSAYKTIRQVIITYTISFLQILPRISTFYFYIPSIFWKINNSNYLTWLAFILQLKLHYSFFCYFWKKKSHFSAMPILNIFAKISRIGPLVCRIDWWEGSISTVKIGFFAGMGVKKLKKLRTSLHERWSLTGELREHSHMTSDFWIGR